MIQDKGPWKKYIGKTEKSHRKIFGANMVVLVEKYGTPLYILFDDIIRENYNKYQESLEKEYKNHLICYAVKANTSYYILNLLAKLGAGADVASEFELEVALNAGIPAEKIRANGNCKSDAYLEECIKKEILISVDPEEELKTINTIAQESGISAKINLRLSGFPVNMTCSSNSELAHPRVWSMPSVRKSMGTNFSTSSSLNLACGEAPLLCHVSKT